MTNNMGYSSLRCELGFQPIDARTGSPPEAVPHLENIIQKYVGRDVVLVLNTALSNKTKSIIGCEFCRGTIKEANKAHIWLNELRYAKAPDDVCDVIPVDSLYTVNVTRGLKVYTFEAFAGEGSERADVIHIDPVAAYLAAQQKTRQRTQRLTGIEMLDKGKVFYTHKDY